MYKGIFHYIKNIWSQTPTQQQAHSSIIESPRGGIRGSFHPQQTKSQQQDGALGTARAHPEVFICIHKDMSEIYSFTFYLKSK